VGFHFHLAAASSLRLVLQPRDWMLCWPSPGGHERQLRGHRTWKKSVRATGSFGEAWRAGLGRVPVLARRNPAARYAPQTGRW